MLINKGVVSIDGLINARIPKPIITQSFSIWLCFVTYDDIFFQVGALKNLVPLLDRVLVEKARGGIGIPEKAQQKVLQGTVVAVGPGTRNNVGALKNLVPLLDRVLVEKARGGIGIPEKAQQKVLQGTVVAVGPGTRNNHGQHIPVTVEVGDKVLLPESAGAKVQFEDKEYYFFF
ncbi:uncharacterized protein LOC136041338 [Artemia franciscana]|uniref:uncharacterized protein LOC136041338 n=1 Tax=Artemia franciscana TaxID=6661 RepID=UPI0032D9D732